MRKGFTLIELLAVIIILAVIALIATPIVLNVVNNAKDSARKSSVAGFADATKLAITEYQFKEQGSVPTVDSAFISTITYQGDKVICGQDGENPGVYYSTSYGIVLHGCKVGDNDTLYYFGSGKVYTDKNDETYKKIFDSVKGIIPENPDYADASGASKPELDNGLVPVIYDGTNWKVADTKTKWYDYDNKEWANTIIVKTGVKANYVKDKVVVEDDVLGYFVWIPRYEYKYTNLGTQYAGGTKEKPGAIDIKFTNASIASSNDYKVHPAFTFGSTELNGLWVAKFEATGDATTPTVKPNVPSLREQNVSTQFTTAQKYTTYGLTNSDSHMMKNSEWGSIAYLTQSIYGRCTSSLICEEVAINNSSEYITGSSVGKIVGDSSIVYTYNTVEGYLASTTGNIYGIYDMSGGSHEYVMGNLETNGKHGSGHNSSSNSGYNGWLGFAATEKTDGLPFPNNKYFDNYTTEISSTACNGTICYGHALSETEGWYSDHIDFLVSYNPWFLRGGTYGYNSNPGLFRYSSTNGISFIHVSFRPVITKP